jgi:hypothetical protein
VKTVEEVIRAVLGSPNRGTPARSWVKMTATRYGHLVELLQKGVSPELVLAAERRINASSWLQKPWHEITEEDITGLLRERPWEKKEPVMTGKEITSLMRKHKVTIAVLAKGMGITMKRVREVRAQGLADANATRDWVQAITGKDPGESAAARTARVLGDISELSSGTLAGLTGLSGYASLDDVRTAFCSWAAVESDYGRGTVPWETWQDAWAAFAAEHPELTREGDPTAKPYPAPSVARVAGPVEPEATAEAPAPAAEAAPAPPADPLAPVVRPLLLLPPNLAGLARLSAADAHARFATEGVQLRSTARGYRAAATDGRVLGVVDGDLPELPEHYPAIPALAAAPGAAAEAVLPADAWKKAFAALPKKAAVKAKPILGNLAVAIGEKGSVLASTDLDADSVLQPAHLDGRFPAVEKVLDLGRPRASFRVSAGLMLRLLQAAEAFAEEGLAPLTVELHKGLVAVRAGREGQEFTGLVVPLKVD